MTQLLHKIKKKNCINWLQRILFQWFFYDQSNTFCGGNFQNFVKNLLLFL